MELWSLIMNYGKLLVAAATAGLISAGSAQAVMITVEAGGVYTSSVDGATTIDFSDGCSYAGGCSGDYAIVSGSLSGQYAAPFDLGANQPFLTVPQPNSNGTTATLDLDGFYNYFGLFWGSIDNYNSITFKNTATNYSESFTGLDLQAVDGSILVQGSQVNLADNRFINFFFGSEQFNIVELYSSQKAFETDNHAFAQVPEPGTLALMALGLAGLGISRKRRKA